MEELITLARSEQKTSLATLRPAEIVEFVVEDFNIAVQILKGELDGTSAYMAGDLNIIGDIQMGMKFSQVAEWLTEMLSDLLS